MKRRKKRKGASKIIAFLVLIIIIALFILVLPGTLKKVSYPVVYREFIEEFSDLYSLDASLVAAIVYTESSYDVNATSNVGARGLMQVMPSTGEWIHGKLKKQYPFNPDVLYTVDGALTYGCWYLDFLCDRFDGDITSVIAAYHAGQGEVEKWLKDPVYSSDGKTLSALPEGARATRHYVEKVKKVYDYYKEVYQSG